MNGILEQILAAIQANTAAINALAAGGGQPGPGAIGTQQTLSPPAPSQPAVGEITSDALMALIQPHIGNEVIKTALGAAMRANGVNNLPEAQPHQYGQLYAAFQNVIKAHTTGSAVQSASII